MKYFKKITAAALALSMAFGLTGCTGGKLSGKKLEANAKKFGADQVKDADEYEDLFDDRDLEDGVYITVSGKDVKDIFKVDTDFSIDDLYDKTIKKATIFSLLNDDDDYFVFVCSLTFGSKKDAQAYYDEMIDDMDDDVFEVEDGKENGVTYTVGVAEDYFYEGGTGIYMNGSTVVVVLAVGTGDIDDAYDVMEEVTEGYDLVLPSDI